MGNTASAWSAAIEPQRNGVRSSIARPNYDLSAPDLAGHFFCLAMDDGSEYFANFNDEERLIWNESGKEKVTYRYFCMRARDGIWLINFMEQKNKCVTLVIDTLNDLVTMVCACMGRNPNRPKLVEHDFVFGALRKEAHPLPVKRHGFTADLVGKKIAWKYSPVVTITHIYNTAFSMRSSLNNMEHLPEDATAEQRADCENRAQRWGNIFFEEPCSYVKIHDDLYLVTFIESNRYRVDPPAGGGDMLIVIDTKSVHDVGRTFGVREDGTAQVYLLTAKGRFVEEPDPMESAPSPYWI